MNGWGLEVHHYSGNLKAYLDLVEGCQKVGDNPECIVVYFVDFVGCNDLGMVYSARRKEGGSF